MVYYPYERPWTWKPLQRANRRKNIVIPTNKDTKMAELRRTEAILRNLAQELLTKEEAFIFKQALHHFRVSHSVTSLCQQLKPIINTTQKILLLVELSSRLPKNLQDDFHHICSLQHPNYETYLKIFNNGNASSEMPRIIAQDSSGKFKIVSRGSEKKMMLKYNSHNKKYEIHSLPGTSVTSGIYSNASSSDDDEDYDLTDGKEQNGRMTPVYLKGKKNVHKVFLNRHDDGSYGFGINGGREYGTEIVINVVEENGTAAKQGLKVGDKILEVNGHSFHDISHVEAVLIMRNAWNLIMHIERPDEKEQNGDDTVDHAPVHQHMQNLELIIYPSNNARLGCVTQRLNSQELLVSSVEENSPASKAGVKANDLITKVDSISVRELSEAQIVMLTQAKRLSLSVRRGALIPVQDHDEVDNKMHSPLTNGHIPVDMVYERHRKVYPRSGSESRSDQVRETSLESRHSSHPTIRYTRENYARSKSAGSFGNGRYIEHPEHLVYGVSKPEPNWMLSSQKPREHRYQQRKTFYSKDPVSVLYSLPAYGRSHSEGSYRIYDSNVSKGRYIRQRSYSPHRNATVSKIHHEDNVIRAIQMGLEKRHRAVRLALYQMPDPADYEWEI